MAGSLSTKEIEIGKVGLWKLFIKVLTIKKSSNPRAAVVCNLHGNETSSLFVISKLLPIILSKIRKGEVDIFVASNPAAFLLRDRTWKDHIDLNRIFPGKADEGLTHLIASKLTEELKQMDLVIDIHNEEFHAPVIGLFMNDGSKNVKESSLKFLKEFAPHVIWEIKEDKFSNALGPFLSRNGIPNFAIEMSSLEFLKPNELSKVKIGLEKVFSTLGIIDSKESHKKIKKAIPVVSWKKIISEDSGIFIPLVSILQKVHKGQKVGRLTSTDLINFSFIKSPIDGIVIHVSPTRFVDTGDELISIGKIERWIE
jgi:predicted deacylase